MKKFNLYLRRLTWLGVFFMPWMVSAQVPANDLICNAIPLSVQLGCTQGTNVNATATGSPTAPNCWQPPVSNNDVWYSFVATVADITLSTDAQGLTLTNTQVAVYSSSNNNCTGTLTMIACAENSGFNVQNNTVTELNLTVGNTYFVRVDGNANATGTFCIGVSNTFTPGSTPCEAQIVHPNNNGVCDIDNGNQITNSTTPATAYFPIGTNYGGCDDETNQYGTWSTFLANSTSVNIENLSNGPRDYTLFNGTCSSLSWVSCTSVQTNGTTTLNNLVPGTRYFILTTLTQGSTANNVRTDFCATNNVPCTPPANNNCANAQPIFANLPYHVTTYCATPDDPPTLCSGTLQNNIWFTWTTPANWTGQAYFQLFEQNCAGGDLSDGTQVSIYNSTVTCGGAANCVATSNTQADNNLNVVWTPTPGATYLINYDGYAGEVCEMDFQVTNTASVVTISVNSATICQGDSVVLTATSPATAYLWSTGQTGSSITVSPQITTSYTVSATAGGTGQATGTVTVNPRPQSPQAGSNAPVCVGATLNLTASTVTGATYQWTGPNGFLSAQQNPFIQNITAAQAGNYIVTATVLNCPSIPDTVAVTVNPIPATPVGSSNAPVCEGGTLSFTANPVGGASYNWTGPSGFVSSLRNPSISNVGLSAQGNYLLSITVLNCESAFDTVAVVVNPLPSAPQLSSNQPICAGDTLRLSASGSASATFNWTGPNGFTSALQNPIIAGATTLASGTYSATQSVSGCAGPASTLVVQVNPVPVAVPTSNSPVCAGNSINLFAANVVGGSYQWTGPNGFTSTLQNPVISNATAADSGVYTLIVTASNCSSAAATVLVTVNPIPVSVATNNGPVCLNDTLKLFASTYPLATYQWSGPNGFTSSLQNPILFPSALVASGTYSVVLTSRGCSNTATISTLAEVKPRPAAPVLSNNGPICAGDSLKLFATVVPSVVYQWSGPNGFTSDSVAPVIPVASVADSGWYSVFLSLNGCAGPRDSTLAVVNRIPFQPNALSNSPVCAGDTLVLSADSVFAGTYAWITPLGDTLTGRNQSFLNASESIHEGNYLLTLTSNGCTGPADTLAIQVVAIPVISFTSNTPICIGLPVNFTNTGTPGALSYQWNFGTGAVPASSALENPSGIVYSTPGIKTVTLSIAELSGCAAVDTQLIEITDIPLADFTSTGPICIPPGLVTFTDSSIGTVTSYFWDFGADATPSTATSAGPIDVVYASGGTKFVSLTVGGLGCTNMTTKPVDIDTVSAEFTSSVPQNGDGGCLGHGENFYNIGSSGSGARHFWNFGAGATPDTSTLENPTNIVYATPGAKIVTHTVFADSCGTSATVAHIITINPSPTASFVYTDSVCLGTSLQFTNTGSTGAGHSFSWDFGNGSSPAISSAESPVGIQYQTPGSKQVTLRITNEFYCVAEVSNTVWIHPKPSAEFMHSGPECSNTPMQFIPLVFDSAYQWNWNLGDSAVPSTSTLFGIDSAYFSLPGLNEVSLTVTDLRSGCSNSMTESILVYASPVVQFTSTAPQCSGTAVNFTNTGSSGSNWNYQWDFGTTATPTQSGAENPGAVVFASGTFPVQLTISDQHCTGSAFQIISIGQTPAIAMHSTAPQCSGVGVDFSNVAGNPNGVSQWVFGADATPTVSTDLNPSGVVFSTGGLKTIYLTVTDTVSFCSRTDSLIILIHHSPVVAFASTAPQCAGASVDFTNTGSTGNTYAYQWNFGATAQPASSTAENPVGIQFSQGGNPLVNLTVSDAFCSSSDSLRILIHATPVADFASTAPNCTGIGIDFLPTLVTSGIGYLWEFGNTALPDSSTDAATLGVTFSAAGNQTIRLTATDSLSGCSASQSRVITIYQTPLVGINSTAPACANTAVNFTNTGSTGGNWTYQWNFGTDAVPSMAAAEQPTGIRYLTSGLKWVTLTIADQYCSHVDTVSISILSTPTADFTSTAPQCTGLPISFTNTGTSTGVSWNWNFGSTALPPVSVTANPDSIIYASAGTSLVTLILTDSLSGCSDTMVKPLLVYASPTVDFISNAPQCAGTGINFSNTGSRGSAWQYSWDFGNGASPSTSVASDPLGIVYATGGNKLVSFSISDAHCSVTDTQTLVIFNLPVALAGNDSIICANTSLTLGSDSISGNDYNWFPLTGVSNPFISNPVVNPVAGSTVYQLTVLDRITRCVNRDQVTVTMLSPLVANAGEDVSICAGDSVQIGSAKLEGQRYTWQADSLTGWSTLSNPYVSPTGTTLFTVSVTDTLGCGPVTDQVTVTVRARPVANAGADDTLMIGNSVQLTGTGGLQYLWSPEEGLSNAALFNPIATPDSSTTYVLQVTDLFGCTNTDTIRLVVFGYETPVWLPTAFTPDGNGHNDVLYVRGGVFVTFDFSIYNRNGDLVFNAKDIRNGWDGTDMFSHEKVPADPYVYLVNGKLENGEQVEIKGLVNVIR